MINPDYSTTLFEIGVALSIHDQLWSARLGRITLRGWRLPLRLMNNP